MATVNFIRYKKQTRGALDSVMRYVMQDSKTLDQEIGARLISGQNCTPQFAAQEFLATRTMHRKQSPVWFYHYTQSFHPDEPVTGKAAHELAKEFAAQAWPDSEVLIATHLDAEHIHSHFVVNAVCCESGRMLRQGPNTLRRLRQISDELCAAHRLSVLPSAPQGVYPGMTAREYRSAVKGQSWKFRLMNTIDECMRYAASREQFISLMRSEGYEVRWTDRRKNITYITPDDQKCRDDRLHDEKYLKEAMERELAIRARLIAGRVETAQSPSEYANADITPHRRRMGRISEPDLFSGTACGSADGLPTDIVQPDRNTPHPIAVRSSAAGYDPNTEDSPTGWEEERTAFFSAEDQLSPSVPVVAVGHPGVDGASRTLAQLGRAVERADNTAPVNDSTTQRSHGDSKTLRREREKKIALGHAEDDHEDAQNCQQTM